MFEKILNNKFIVIYLIPFFLGSLTVFSFQPFNLSFINFLLLPIFFLLIVYVNKKLKSTYRKKPFKRNFFLLGFIFGFGFYLSGIFWIAHSLTFDESFKFLIPIAIFVIPLFLGLFLGITILIIGPFLKNDFSSLLLFSGSIALSDFIRGKILTGFPWNVWSYSLSWFTEILQILNKIGFYSFNLIVITIFSIPAIFFFRKKNSYKFITLSLAFIFCFSSYIYGTFKINTNQALLNYLNKDNKIFTKIVSPNFELVYDTPILEIEKKIKKLIKISEPDSNKETLFVWPEGVFAGYNLEQISELSFLIEKSFSNNHFILFGINTFNEDRSAYFNSLVIVDNKMNVLKKYNKIKLVPFGEFLPFGNFLDKFGVKKITEGYGSFLKGNTQDNIILENMNILPLICYEVIFTELVQKADNKTNLIVNISEDGWFGRSIGPYQHFAKAIFRSIENDTFLLRSANMGISAIINNKGEIVKQLNVNEEGNIEMNIPLIKSKFKNKNDLIFFLLLFTYLIIFLIFKNKINEK